MWSHHRCYGHGCISNEISNEKDEEKSKGSRRFLSFLSPLSIDRWIVVEFKSRWLEKCMLCSMKFPLKFHRDCFCLNNVYKRGKIYATTPSSFVIIVIVIAVVIIHFHFHFHRVLWDLFSLIFIFFCFKKTTKKSYYMKALRYVWKFH